MRLGIPARRPAGDGFRVTRRYSVTGIDHAKAVLHPSGKPRLAALSRSVQTGSADVDGLESSPCGLAKNAGTRLGHGGEVGKQKRFTHAAVLQLTKVHALRFPNAHYCPGPRRRSAAGRPLDRWWPRAATTGSEPPLPGSTGARLQVSAQARRNASKAWPEESIRCGSPSRCSLTFTSAPQGARLRRCSRIARNACCVSSPGARRTLMCAVADGIS